MMRDLIGQHVGNYQLVKLLGRGGFAEVYLGQHVRLPTQVAVKVLHAHLADEQIKGFEQEAKTIASLEHPHIVRILDFDITNGIPFLVMDYCPNGSLRKRYAKGDQVPLPTVVSSAQQVADALQYAHENKIIHRDVKPENMLIGQRNMLLLSDFGIAATAHSTSSMSTQIPIGTIPYMAPEQIQAQARPASDQYALGIVVYEWLCGTRPFEGSYTEIFAKHLMTPPPPLREKVPTLPPEVEQVVLRALEKDPKQRFATVQAFAIALEQASQPTSLPKSISLPSHSHPLPTLLASPPAQTAISPLLPSTQLATSSPRQTGLSASTNSPTNAQPIARVANEKINIWQIGKREVVATLIGIVLCAGLSYLFNLFTPYTDGLWQLPAFLIAALLGMRLGPWAGLVTGGVGMFISELFDFSWYTLARNFLLLPLGGMVLSSALAGFAAGLTILITKRRYNIRNVVIADAMIAITVFLSLGILTIDLTVPQIIFFLNQAVLFSISVLIFLPILLIIYNAIVNRRSSPRVP